MKNTWLEKRKAYYDALHERWKPPTDDESIWIPIRPYDAEYYVEVSEEITHEESMA
jgi:hypothetical protein